MAEMPILEAVARPDAGKGAARAARREGYVPGVIYGGGTPPETINIRFNALIRKLKAGRFMATLLNVQVDGRQNRVICRAVQRDVVKDLPIHVDFLRLTERSRVNLYIPVEFVNHADAPGLKKGGVLTVVRPEVELTVTAGDIPEKLTVDLAGKQIGDVIHISDIALPSGARSVIQGRDFVIANLSAPAGLVSSEAEDDAAAAAAPEPEVEPEA